MRAASVVVEVPRPAARHAEAVLPCVGRRAVGIPSRGQGLRAVPEARWGNEEPCQDEGFAAEGAAGPEAEAKPKRCAPASTKM